MHHFSSFQTFTGHLPWKDTHLSSPTLSSYQIWIKCNKRQMTSCVHKMCGWTYGQTSMKRAITLAKINHPWNRYMCMLSSWPTKILNMNKIPYVRSHILCTQLVICRILFIFGILIGHDLSMCILYRFHGWLIFARVNSPFHVCLTICPSHI
jgi:hypothetical protein